MRILVNTIYKSKLIFNKRVYECQVGKNGILPQYKKIEGDKSTPMGKWKILTIFIRRDKKLKLKLNKYIKNKIVFIKKNFIWCDDIKSFHYNKLLKVNDLSNLNYSYEKLFRDDEVYDIILELNQNQRPCIKNKGSAIFIHCSFNDLRSTFGCVALKKNILNLLINNLQKQNYIYIR